MKQTKLKLLAVILLCVLVVVGCSPQEEEPAAPVADGITPFNQLVSGAFQAPGDTIAYTFEGTADQALYLEVRSIEEGAVDFMLAGPDGREIFASTGRDYRPHSGDAQAVLRHENAYTLTLTARGEDTPGYAFILWHVDPPVIEAGEIQPGNRHEGRIDISGQVAEYYLDGQAGQPIFLEVHAVGEGSIDFVLTGPDGMEVFSTTSRDYRPASGNAEVTLQQGGRYTLTLNPRGADIPDYAFVLYDVGEAVIEGAALQFGVLNRGEIGVPGQMVEYALEGRAGQELFLEVREIDNGAIDFTLIGPDGLEVSSTTGRDYRPDSGNTEIALRETGDYVLTLNPRDADTPAYAFILWEVDPKVIAGEMIQLDVLIRGQVETPGQIVEYLLEGSVGQTLMLEALAIDEGSVDFILTGPDGQELFSSTGRDYRPSSADTEFTLDQEGPYTLTVNPRDASTPAFEFIVRVNE